VKEKPNGKGRFIKLDIDYYEGDFVNGRYEGCGKYWHMGGDQYEGEYRNGLYDG